MTNQTATTIPLLILTWLASNASGQLISPSGVVPLAPTSLEIATDIPPKLQGAASLTFVNLDICFDGGSQGAFFDRHDGGKLKVFFPHPGYWTAAARQERKQPVALLTHRNGKPLLLEITPESRLNQRIVALIDADIASGRHSPEQLATLRRIRESIHNRSPLPAG